MAYEAIITIVKFINIFMAHILYIVNPSKHNNSLLKGNKTF